MTETSDSGIVSTRQRRVMAVLPKRFGKYGLTIHPDKTRLVPFRKPTGDRQPPDSAGISCPGTFDFLGFTHLGVTGVPL